MSNMLQREYDALRSERVGLRREIELLGKQASIAATSQYYDMRKRIEFMLLRLKCTEKRWAELGMMLGRVQGPPVKLSHAPRTRAQPVRLRATRTAPTGYMTRMLSR